MSYGPAHSQSCNNSARLPEGRGHEAGALARRHRLNWPEGAANRRSAKAVAKLTGLSPLLSSLGEESLQVPHRVYMYVNDSGLSVLLQGPISLESATMAVLVKLWVAAS